MEAGEKERWQSTSGNYFDSNVQDALKITAEETIALYESEAVTSALEQVQQWKQKWKANQIPNVKLLSRN